jgi:hypothetical protein
MQFSRLALKLGRFPINANPGADGILGGLERITAGSEKRSAVETRATRDDVTNLR